VLFQHRLLHRPDTRPWFPSTIPSIPTRTFNILNGQTWQGPRSSQGMRSRSTLPTTLRAGRTVGVADHQTAHHPRMSRSRLINYGTLVSYVVHSGPDHAS
jgi:hypothetical protein